MPRPAAPAPPGWMRSRPVAGRRSASHRPHRPPRTPARREGTSGAVGVLGEDDGVRPGDHAADRNAGDGGGPARRSDTRCAGGRCAVRALTWERGQGGHGACFRVWVRLQPPAGRPTPEWLDAGHRRTLEAAPKGRHYHGRVHEQDIGSRWGRAGAGRFPGARAPPLREGGKRLLLSRPGRSGTVLGEILGTVSQENVQIVRRGIRGFREGGNRGRDPVLHRGRRHLLHPGVARRSRVPQAPTACGGSIGGGRRTSTSSGSTFESSTMQVTRWSLHELTGRTGVLVDENADRRRLLGVQGRTDRPTGSLLRLGRRARSRRGAEIDRRLPRCATRSSAP